MKDNNEIIIDADIEHNKEFPNKNSEKEINPKEKENLKKIEEGLTRKSEENQSENEFNNNFENINETENIELTNNNDINNINLLYQLSSTERKDNNLDKKVVSQKESTTTINNTNMNDLSTIPTKEEQNFEPNNQYQNINVQNNNNIIDETEEYKSIENIINSREDDTRNLNNNIFSNNNNKVYFTETDIPALKLKKVLQKSGSTKLYTISAIPEYPKGYARNTKVINKEKINTSDRIESPKKTKKKNTNEKLNNLSTNDYKRKKIVNKYNFKPLQYRIKKIEEEIIKQNNYDYNRVMKEMQLKYDKDKKNKEKEKIILEYHKKLEQKLKKMEEKRTILYNQRLENLTKKQHHSSVEIPYLQKRNINRSFENNLSYSSKNIITGSNIKTNKIEAYSNIYDKIQCLPSLIPNLPKYELIKLMKNKIEEEFCNDTKKKLQENEINYLKHIKLINNKLSKQNKIFRQRSSQCLLVKKNKDESLEKEFIEKDMIKRYNIRNILQRERSAKNERIKKKFIINYDIIKSKRELLEKQDEEKIQQTIKRLNKNMIKKSFKRYNNRDYYENLQRQNLKQYNKDIDSYYKEMIIRQRDNVLIINEFQNGEPDIKQNIIKRVMNEQNKKFKKLKSLDKFREKMDKININNQTEGKKKKIFNKILKEEEEKKRKEEESGL